MKFWSSVLSLLIFQIGFGQMKTENLIKVNDSLWVRPGDVFIDNYNVISLSKILFDFSNLNTIQAYHSEGRINLCSRNFEDYAIIGTRIVHYPIINLDSIVFSVKKSSNFNTTDSVTIVVNDNMITNPEQYLIEINNHFKIEIIKNSNPKNDHGYNAKTTIIIKNRKEE